MKDRTSKIWGDFIPAFITLMVFMGVIAVKGIFPFGANTIDYYDMGQEMGPLYYHIWDVLHGKSSFFYSWYIDLGQNLSMSSSVEYDPSIYSLFFLLIPREYCLKALSLYMGLRLFFMSFNMSIFLRKTVKTPYAYRVAFSTAYGLCGYTLTHYTVPTFLDMAALFPLLMLAVYRVLKGEKRRIGSTSMYAVFLGYMLILSYYLSIMNLIFILLVSGAYILILCKKEDRGGASKRLIIGTAGGVCLSMCTVLPAFLQLMGSTRASSEETAGILQRIMDLLRSVGADMYYMKWWQLSGSLMAMAVILAGIIKYRKEKRENLFVILACFFPCALIPFESINLLWHMGSYYQYPLRCGYIIAFALLAAAAYYAGKGEAPVGIKAYEEIGCAAFTLIFSAAVNTYYMKHEIWDVKELFKAWVIFAIVLFVIYLALFISKRKPAYKFSLLMGELIITAFIAYGGQPHFTDFYFSSPEQSGRSIEKAERLKEELGIEESRTVRIKNPDTDLNTNYGLIMRRATVTGWAHTVGAGQMDSMEKLGQGTHFTRILDSGGTLFTDALMNVRQTLTCREFAGYDLAYEKNGEADGYRLYDNMYTLPFVMPVSSKEAKETDLKSLNVWSAQNEMYRLLGGKDGDIFIPGEGENCHVEGKKAIYFYGTETDGIKINGQTVPVPTIGDMDNTAYPAWFNSALLCGGIFEDEDIRIEGFDKPAYFILDVDKLEELCGKYEGRDVPVRIGSNTLEFTVTSDGEKDMAMLSLCPDKGMRVKVNGRRAEPLDISGVFTGIPLKEGSNEVKIRMIPRGMPVGTVISLLTLLAVILYEILCKPNAKADTLCKNILVSIWSLAVIILYIVPVCAFIIHQVVKRL